ncbi:MAG: type II secretion system minor pseudopilin GspI [Gammaproteobacteria bacterium]|nr:type II secretion system minor pseudopilin GspI [Gammaproteobacteria bacterium]
MRCSKRPGLCQGFTLLEVIIALGIVAVGILAVSRAITGYAETTATLEQRMVANWVAANRLETLRMLASKPVPGTDNGSEEMAGRVWYFREATTVTADPYLFRIDITVYIDKGETEEVGQLYGYLLDTPEIINTEVTPSPGLGGIQPPPVKKQSPNQSIIPDEAQRRSGIQVVSINGVLDSGLRRNDGRPMNDGRSINDGRCMNDGLVDDGLADNGLAGCVG